MGHAAYWLGSLEVMAMGLVACGLGTVFLAAQFLIPGFNRLTAGASFAVLLAAFALQGVGAALAFVRPSLLPLPGARCSLRCIVWCSSSDPCAAGATQRGVSARAALHRSGLGLLLRATFDALAL